jgi:hypothetical protein
MIRATNRAVRDFSDVAARSFISIPKGQPSMPEVNKKSQARLLDAAIAELDKISAEVAALIQAEPGLLDTTSPRHAWLSRLETAVADFRTRQK